jgi:hypothetical protein
MSRLGNRQGQSVLGQKVSNLVEAIGEGDKVEAESIQKLPEVRSYLVSSRGCLSSNILFQDDALWDQQPLTLAMVRANWSAKHEVQFKKTGQVLNTSNV